MSLAKMSSQLKTTTPPPPCPSYLLSSPAPHVLLVTINRPRAMNSLPYGAHWEAEAIFSWFDGEPNLRVAIVTGAGPKAFCAGQDLIEQGVLAEAAERERQEQIKRGGSGEKGIERTPEAGYGHKGQTQSGLPPRQMMTHPKSGFMAVSRRTEGKKPIIAAVNGFAMGGGFEICLGCDMVLASPTASFGLPEASRGLYAAAGGLSRLVRLVGLPVASEVALAGRVLTAQEAYQLRVINRVSQSPETLLQEAVDMAEMIGNLSPDAVIVTKAGLRDGLENGSVEEASRKTEERYGRGLREGENIRRGLQAFKEKRPPQWVPSKL